MGEIALHGLAICFFDKISPDAFLSINKYVMGHSNNELIEIQSILNLILLSNSDDLIEKLINRLLSCEDSASFYRALNGLRIEKNIKAKNKKILERVLNVIKLNPNVPSLQKAELLNSFSELLLNV